MHAISRPFHFAHKSTLNSQAILMLMILLQKYTEDQDHSHSLFASYLDVEHTEPRGMNILLSAPSDEKKMKNEKKKCTRTNCFGDSFV